VRDDALDSTITHSYLVGPTASDCLGFPLFVDALIQQSFFSERRVFATPIPDSYISVIGIALVDDERFHPTSHLTDGACR